MNAVVTVEAAPHFWSEEPSGIPGRRRIRARIGGLHCSLCTGTIEKALGRQPGVNKVAVSLTHEQALIEYDPSVARAEDLLQTLEDIGYTVSDPRKLRPFEEEERALVRERWRFLTALTMSIAAMGLVGYPVDFLHLRSRGRAAGWSHASAGEVPVPAGRLVSRSTHRPGARRRRDTRVRDDIGGRPARRDSHLW